jgi:hypothetical protein
MYIKKRLVVGRMKHGMEESSGGIALKQCKVRELEKLPTLEELGKINFLDCTHGSIWTLMKEKANWAKKIGLAKIKKLDWTLVDEPVVKEMINNYNRVDQDMNLKGKQIDVGEEGMARIFCISYKRIIPIGKESYKPIVATYLIGNEHEHYIICSSYLIAKTNGKQKVAKLEALPEIMSFK